MTSGEEGASKSKIDIIEDWALIEADFQREYGIDLVSEIGGMSWRRFSVLLSGLSRDAVFIVSKQKDKDQPKVIEGTDPEAADVVRSFFA